VATASTAGSTAPRRAEAEPEPGFVARFGLTERTLHWVHTVGFLAMLASGLVLYLPPLSGLASREAVKAVHLGVAIAWMTAVLLVAVSGDTRQLRRTRREIEELSDDDLDWLRRRPAPQGRFNAGQKVHTIIQAALAALFVISGSLLWLGERSNAFRLPGSVALHDGAMFVATFLLLGHLFLALIWPKTRPAMRGIVRGTVRADWAHEQHAAWAAEPPPAERPSRRLHRPLAGFAITAVGVLAAVLITTGNLEGTPSRAAAGPGSAASTGPAPTLADNQAPPPGSPPLKPGADILSLTAQQAAASGDFSTAIRYLQQAIKQDGKRADLRRTLGLVLAQSGDVASAEIQLRQAVAMAPQDPDGHFLLGAVEVQAGKRAAGRRELESYLRARPQGQHVGLARTLLKR
jgi:formate dehydrogenase subunit gamma